MVGVLGIVLVHTVDGVGDLSDGHLLLPHPRNFVVWERAVQTPLRVLAYPWFPFDVETLSLGHGVFSL